MPEPPEESDASPRSRRDYARALGVIESFTVVTQQCPNGAVRGVAERALEAARQGDRGVLREQAYFVLTAIKGWRGERASQVHRSLKAFIDTAIDRPGDPEQEGS